MNSEICFSISIIYLGSTVLFITIKDCKLSTFNFLITSPVNLFFELNKKLASLMAPYDDYKVEMEEIHHTQKLDAPSGTAITLAEGVIDNLPKVGSWVNE